MFKHYIGALLVVLLLVFATSCGGGSSAQPGTGDGDDTPGLMDNIDAPADASDFPQAQAISGDWPDAPLGTDTAYNVQPASGTVVGHVAAKVSSALEDGQMFAVVGATIAEESIAEADLDWDAENISFNEGTKVSFWIKYEVVDDLSYVRRWSVPESNLDYAETVTNADGGVYTVRFDYTLPYLEGTTNIDAVFTGTLALPQGASSVIIVDPGTSSGSVPFTIAKVITDPYNYSSEEAQMGWEDLIVNSDYDYNDFVTRMLVTERRRHSDNKLVQIDLWVKAKARGAGYDGSWQFNIDGAFPGSTVVAYIDQFYADGTPHGSQRIWTSSDGASIPVFTSNKIALPQPPESYATNTVVNTTFIDGDYANVTILFDTPLEVGSYTPMPYKPQLRVFANNGSVYIIGLWTRRGDPVDCNGRPLAFIIPFNYAWPIEGRRIWYGYPRFNNWVYWVNHLELPDEDQPDFWNDTPVWKTNTTYNVFQPSLFK